MPNVFFTADTHYGHTNVIRYGNRPFASSEEMNEAMIDRWNAVVRPGDVVYHLGDFSLTRMPEACTAASRLRGNKYLVFGNHDKYTRKSGDFLKHWVWARDYAEVDVSGIKIVLLHYAMKVWHRSHHGAWQLHGHSHGSLKDDPNALQIDVGVDCWNFAPVAFETLKIRMETKTWRPIDHHGARDGE